jgi:hypothetical protein
MTDTIDGFDMINMVQFQNHGPNDVIEAWTQPPAGHDGAFQLAGIKIDLVPGTGLFKTEQRLTVIDGTLHIFRLNVHNDPGII